MRIVTTVLLSKEVTRDLDLLPPQILKKFRGWTISVEIIGLRETRKIPGFHDEPLQGKRIGQRSVRLNRSYRAIYIELPHEGIEIIKVIEVNKHEY